VREVVPKFLDALFAQNLALLAIWTPGHSEAP
jgi:hypothetical protein